ncbi:hypothetical protein BJ742DRAFT_87659 [Cladochytrium replicatum]|nr:hypothetical protein BJ742DRAFT_87659 [Cladochytrium replicatum]
MDESPVAKANGLANAADEFTERGQYAKAVEAHFRAAEQFLLSVNYTNDPEAVKMLKMLYRNHTRKGQELQRRYQQQQQQAQHITQAHQQPSLQSLNTDTSLDRRVSSPVLRSQPNSGSNSAGSSSSPLSSPIPGRSDRARPYSMPPNSMKPPAQYPTSTPIVSGRSNRSSLVIGGPPPVFSHPPQLSVTSSHRDSYTSQSSNTWPGSPMMSQDFSETTPAMASEIAYGFHSTFVGQHNDEMEDQTRKSNVQSSRGTQKLGSAAGIGERVSTPLPRARRSVESPAVLQVSLDESNHYIKPYYAESLRRSSQESVSFAPQHPDQEVRQSPQVRDRVSRVVPSADRQMDGSSYYFLNEKSGEF